jgi:hypothetical protein
MSANPNHTGDQEPSAGLNPTGLALLRIENRRQVDLNRWGGSLIAVGWIHLGYFLICQIVYTSGNLDALPMLSLWLAELVTILLTMGWILGPGWTRQSTLTNLVFKIWVTFLILSFNVASLNQLSGLSTDWFKPIWATLSTFVFMMLTFLFTPWFFAGAVQMYFTGLLMVVLPAWNYLIYGASWCLALTVTGTILVLRHRPKREPARAGTDRAIGRAPSLSA